jgi:hypothetical protein
MALTEKQKDRVMQFAYLVQADARERWVDEITSMLGEDGVVEDYVVDAYVRACLANASTALKMIRKVLTNEPFMQLASEAWDMTEEAYRGLALAGGLTEADRDIAEDSIEAEERPEEQRPIGEVPMPLRDHVSTGGTEALALLDHLVAGTLDERRVVGVAVEAFAMVAIIARALGFDAREVFDGVMGVMGKLERSSKAHAIGDTPDEVKKIANDALEEVLRAPLRGMVDG